MLIKGSEAGKLAGEEGGMEAAGTHSGAKACEFVCVERDHPLATPASQVEDDPCCC